MSQSESQVVVGLDPWVFQTSRGEVSITADVCSASWPCQGHELKSSFGNARRSVDIWRFIKQYPELEQTHPELWDHFKEYNKISLGK